MEEYTIKIKQDRYTTPEEFRDELQDALVAVFDLARMGDDMPPSEVANRFYILHYLLRDTEISIEEPQPLKA